MVKSVFSARLRESRKKRGWTQGELAERVGVTRTTVSRWESGEGVPTEADTLLDVSDALAVSLRWLIGRTDSAEVPIHVNAEELAMIRQYREIPARTRELLLDSFRETHEWAMRMKKPAKK